MSSSTAQAAKPVTCPENLSHLGEEMDALLKGVHVKEFKRTIRSALQASIPQAIERADGIKSKWPFFEKKFNTRSAWKKVPTSLPATSRKIRTVR